MGNGRAHVTVTVLYIAAVIILAQGWLSPIAAKVRSAAGKKE